MRKTISLVLVLVLGLASVGLAAEDTWIYRADMPTARTWAGGCVIDGKIYVIGGGTSASSVTSAVEVYDPIVDTWTKLANPKSRTFTYPSLRIMMLSGFRSRWTMSDS